MMLSARSLTFALVLLCRSTPAYGDAVMSSDPGCPTIDHYLAPQHQNTVCDVVGQNQYKQSLGRHLIKQRLQEEGTHAVPSEHTSYCPQTVTPLNSEQHRTGFDTSWVIENTATVPVVVSYLEERGDGTFAEVSAFDNKISPAQNDPRTILKPGEWKAFMAWEGSVFHVREVLKDGSAGMVLMQHRIGMVDITNKFGHELNCDPTEADVEPVLVKPDGVERDPSYARTQAEPMRPCNVLDVGFRNKVGCPVNAYYTGHYLLKSLVRPRGNVTEWREKLAKTPKSCHERFEFHLGLNPKPQDFMWSWDSPTKYESAYLEQNFVFRLAKDEQVVVDSVTLKPTKVIDCPGLKNQANAVSLPYGEAIMNPIGRKLDYHMRDEYLLKNLNQTISNATDPTQWIHPASAFAMMSS